MSFAVGTAVNLVTIWQKTLESFGVCHFYLLCWKCLTQFRTGRWRIATLGFCDKRNPGICRQKLLFWSVWGIFCTDERQYHRACSANMPWPAPRPTAPTHSTYLTSWSRHQLDRRSVRSLCGCVLLAQAVRQPGLVGSSVGHEPFSLSWTKLIYKACLILIKWPDRDVMEKWNYTPILVMNIVMNIAESSNTFCIFSSTLGPKFFIVFVFLWYLCVCVPEM